MSSKTRQVAYVLQMHKADTVGFTAVALDIYATLFRHIDESTASEMTIRKSEEFRILPSSSANVMALSKKLKNVLSSKRKRRYHAILLEMLDRDTDVDTYDDVCEALYLALDDTSTTRPWYICIVVSNQSAFQESVILKRRLVPHCESNNIGLILLSSTEETIEPSVLCQGTLPRGEGLPVLKGLQYEEGQEEEGEKRLSTEEITEAFQILFGHFKIRVNGTFFHVPAVASVSKLAKITAFLDQLKADISRKLSNKSFNIYPFGIPYGGINELSLGLADGDANRICSLTTIKERKELPLVILCDFLSSVYPIQNVIQEARTQGIKTIVVAGIASYQDFTKFEGIETISYLDTVYNAFLDGDPLCKFCSQGVPLIKGEHFEDYAREVEQFEPFTFWEFVCQHRNFYSVGHWPSDRTPNHYLFRIMTAPIFSHFSYCVSVRLRNILRSKGILPAFVRKIICTEGEESTALSTNLSEVLGLRREDVIRIPRRFFGSIAGKELGADLQEYIESEYGQETLRRQTVLIVDQAAHHFKTLSSLRSICEYYDCVVLAFLVFVDRTDRAFSLGEYLPDSNYIALYSWPVTPRRSHECPCTVG